MPRSAVKSQAGKSRWMSSVPVTPLPTQELEIQMEIIPGRLTQTQWKNMLIQEDSDEIVGEIMDELLNKVMDGCLKVYIERQIVPYSVSWATNYLTEFLKQQIMCPDEGEEPEVASKTEDSEPMPAVCDAWARGYVPVVFAIPPISHPTPAQQEADVVQVPSQTGTVDQQCDEMAKTNSSRKQPHRETSPRRPVNNNQHKVLIPQPPPKNDVRKKQQLNFPRKPVPSKFPPILSCSAVKKDAGVEDRRGVYFNYNNMVGPFYQSKEYQSTPRLDPPSLARHCISPQYGILDSNLTKSNPNKTSRLSNLEPRYSKEKNDWTLTTLTLLNSSKEKPAMFQRKNGADLFLKKLSPFRLRQEGKEFSGSLQPDTMVLSQGVSRRHPQMVASNPLP